ncbi:MAG: AMP-binding protein, partial [Chloroflexi bacterium]|nr:AMP-binding protein [Chloroflexota bacterium]
MTTAPVAVALPDWVALRARTHGDHVAVEAPDATLTYAALDERVGAAAAALQAHGLGAGEPLAVLISASAGFAVAAHAVPRAGGVLMPLNARLTATELAWQLTDAGARFVVADEASRVAAEAAARAAGGVTVIEAETLVGEPTDPLRSSRVKGAAQPEPRPPVHSGRPESERAPAPGIAIDPSRAHSVIYTSGTTGRPKGAVLTHGNFHWSAVGSALNLGVEPADRWLACMPLFHVGGLSILLRSAIYGTTAVVHERFDEARANRALREEGITLLSVVATMLARMLDADGAPYPASVRAVLVGGGPAPRALL